MDPRRTARTAPNRFAQESVRGPSHRARSRIDVVESCARGGAFCLGSDSLRKNAPRASRDWLLPSMIRFVSSARARKALRMAAPRRTLGAMPFAIRTAWIAFVSSAAVLVATLFAAPARAELAWTLPRADGVHAAPPRGDEQKRIEHNERREAEYAISRSGTNLESARTPRERFTPPFVGFHSSALARAPHSYRFVASAQYRRRIASSSRSRALLMVFLN